MCLNYIHNTQTNNRIKYIIVPVYFFPEIPVTEDVCIYIYFKQQLSFPIQNLSFAL